MKNYFLGLIAGSFLTFNIYFTNLISIHSSPIFASFITHLVGTLVSILFLFLSRKYINVEAANRKSPFWIYLGGVFGAITMIIFTLILNTGISISIMLCFVLTGQILFSVLTDILGILGVQKKTFTFKDLKIASCILIGSILILWK